MEEIDIFNINGDCDDICLNMVIRLKIEGISFILFHRKQASYSELAKGYVDIIFSRNHFHKKARQPNDHTI